MSKRPRHHRNHYRNSTTEERQANNPTPKPESPMSRVQDTVSSITIHANQLLHVRCQLEATPKCPPDATEHRSPARAVRKDQGRSLDPVRQAGRWGTKRPATKQQGKESVHGMHKRSTRELQAGRQDTQKRTRQHHWVQNQPILREKAPLVERKNSHPKKSTGSRPRPQSPNVERPEMARP
jgi:hypothetical protein